MVILQDTRERKPLKFKHPWIKKVVKTTLVSGDYGCQFLDGHIPPVFFERKSIGDLFGTLTSGYKRFKKEVVRANSNGGRLILIVEGSMNKVLKGHEHSSVQGSVIIKTIMTLWDRYGVTPVFCSNRPEMAQFITEYYMAVGRNRCKQLGFSKLKPSVTVKL